MENCGKCRPRTSLPDFRFHEWTFSLGSAILIILGVLSHVTPFGLSQDSFIQDYAQLTFPKYKDVYRGYNPSEDKNQQYYRSGELMDDYDYSDDQQKSQHREYPIVVPKRAALILDRIFREMGSAKDNNKPSPGGSKKIIRTKDGVYIPCFFNAVTCFSSHVIAQKKKFK